MIYTNKVYISLEDLIIYGTGLNEIPAEYFLGDEVPQGAKLKDIIENVIGSPTESNPINSAESVKFWEQYFVSYYINEYIGAYDELEGDNEILVYEQFIRKYINKYRLTCDKYNKLIKLYKDNENNLLAEIKSNNVTKFNDTPQNNAVYGDDNHTSNITTSQSSTEGTTLMNRLKEIQDNIEKLYQSWLNEFSGIFIEGGYY